LPGLDAVVTAVVFPSEATALEATAEATHAGLVKPILIGPRPRILRVAAEAKLDIADLEIDDVRYLELRRQETVFAVLCQRLGSAAARSIRS